MSAYKYDENVQALQGTSWDVEHKVHRLGEGNVAGPTQGSSSGWGLRFRIYYWD